MKQRILKCALILFVSSFVSAADSDIRLNSLGFLPQVPKKVSIAAQCTDFTVRKASDNSIVFSGKVTGPTHQNDINQDVCIADFSEIVQPGKYYLDVPGVGKSYEFEIGDKVYDFAYYTAMRAFYLWRCGCAVETVHNGIQYSHEACHTDDAYQDYMGINDTSRRDGTKGWHDAGDFGKYTVNAGITMGCLFMAWDHFGDKLKNISLNLPDTAPGYPDFLKELKWETDWLLTMQYPDGTGRVSHKLTRLNFSGFIMPENDKEKRYYTGWGSAATADFVAMMAMSARYFKPYDAEYAQKCLDAAKVSYKFLQDNPANAAPDQRAFSTGGYGTTDPDDRLWAAAEMWETTGDPECLKDLETRISAPQVTRGFGRRGFSAGGGVALKVDEDWDWGNVRNLGMFTYVLSQRQGRDPNLLESVKNDVIAAADGIVAKANADVYGRTLGTRYYWGCNGGLGRQALNLNVADKIQHKEEYKNAMLDIIGQLFGRNSYGRSFVTGLGHNPPMHPHDRRSGADGIEAPWPGYVVGGGQNALNWQDVQENYQTNEIAINWQAGLVYALAAFVNFNTDSGEVSDNQRIVDWLTADFGDHQVFQRTIGTTQGKVKVSGKFDHSDVTRIEAQVVDFTTGKTIVTWQEIPSEPKTGQFSGTIIVPQGYWYRLVVRALNGTNIEMGRSKGANPWGVGINILCIGQSNMVGNGSIHTYHSLDNDMAGLYCNERKWKKFADPYDGGGFRTDIDYDSWIGVSMIPSLLNSLAQSLPGIPIGIVPAARGSTPIHGTDKLCWLYRDEANHFNSDNLYGNSIAKAQTAGGIELIIMHQGETDATNSVSAQQYQADLKTLLSHYREDLYPSVPLFICQLARSFTAINEKKRTDSTMQEIRSAQLLSDDPPNIYLASLCIDVAVRPNDDHYFQNSYDTIGARIGNCISCYYGKSKFYRGPYILSAKLSEDRKSIDVSIAQRGGSDLTPDSGITGFDVLDSTGVLPITSLVKIDPVKIRLNLSAVAPSGQISLRYLYGKSPNITGAVHDNSLLQLPLEPTIVPIVVSEQ